MILFGPPGTSKTTIAKAVAKHLEWPLMTITPALFLSRGPDGIDASATKVFADLRQLERVVVFFDECDELFRQRPTVDGPSYQLSMAALITGAMLPRLQDLHDRGKLIFILATNRLMSIDAAVRREGRIDHIIAIGPPSESARSMLLKTKAATLPERHRDMIVTGMERFTRDEVIRTAEHLVKFYKAKPKTTPTQLKVEAQKFLGEQDLTINAQDWKQFEDQRDRFSRPHKPGWRD
jgi:SpoVK/Ycf46/Vps4 family AAA+-type ATPase